MKIPVLICRILLGMMFVIFGANILHPFLPMTPHLPGYKYRRLTHRDRKMDRWIGFENG
jgi:hypothetical protein